MKLSPKENRVYLIKMNDLIASGLTEEDAKPLALGLAKGLELSKNVSLQLGTKQDGEDLLLPRDYAYVENMDVPSTWFLRIDTKAKVTESISQLPELIENGTIEEDVVENVKTSLRNAWDRFYPEEEYPEAIVFSQKIPEEPEPETKEGIMAQVKTLLGKLSGIEKKKDIIKSVDEEKRLALFIVMEPNVFDAHGDMATAEEIEKACINFNVHCNKANLYHMVETEHAKIVQSFISPVDFETETGREIRKGTWLQWWWFPPEDEISQNLWKAVKDGEIEGVSIGARGFGEELEDD